MARFSIATIRIFGGLLFGEKACRFQLAALPKMVPEKMLFPKEIEDYYMHDMPLVRRETLYTMYRTYLMQYMLKDSIGKSTAQVMYWYGEKEMKCVKKSAKMFQSLLPSCRIYEAKNYNHGYLAIYLPDEWLAIAEPFFNETKQ